MVWCDFHKVCLDGDFKLMVQNLDSGTWNVHDQDNMGNTPLHYVCMSGNYRILTYLMERTKIHVHLNTQNQSGCTALHYACGWGHLHIVKYLLEHTRACEGIRLRNKDGYTAFHFAARNSHMDVMEYIVKLFCEKDPSVLEIDYPKKKRGDRQTSSFFQEVVDIFQSVGPRGWSSLHTACRYGNRNMVKTILCTTHDNIYEWSKTHLYEETSDGETSLHLAIKNGNLDLISFLLTGTDCYTLLRVQPLKNGGNTPLHIACLVAKLPVVKYLIFSAGAGDTLFVQNHDGNTPLHLACHSGRLEIIEFIMKEVCKYHHKLLYITNNEEKAPLDDLLEKVDIHEIEDKIGGYMLRYYTLRNDLPVVKKFLRKGMFHRGKIWDDENRTPLHIACQEGFADIVASIINIVNNYELRTKDINGRNILHSACLHGDLEIVKIILESGQYMKNLIYDLDNEGNSPIDIAVEYKNEKVAAYLSDIKLKDPSADLYIKISRNGNAGTFKKGKCASLLLLNVEEDSEDFKSEWRALEIQALRDEHVDLEALEVGATLEQLTTQEIKEQWESCCKSSCEIRRRKKENMLEELLQKQENYVENLRSNTVQKIMREDYARTMIQQLKNSTKDLSLYSDLHEIKQVPISPRLAVQRVMSKASNFSSATSMFMNDKCGSSVSDFGTDDTREKGQNLTNSSLAINQVKEENFSLNNNAAPAAFSVEPADKHNEEVEDTDSDTTESNQALDDTTESNQESDQMKDENVNRITNNSELDCVLHKLTQKNKELQELVDLRKNTELDLNRIERKILSLQKTIYYRVYVMIFIFLVMLYLLLIDRPFLLSVLRKIDTQYREIF